MFEFLKETIRETYLEVNGIKIDENSKRIVKTKSGEIKYLENEEKVIMKKKTKISFFVIGILLLLLNVYGIYFSVAVHFDILNLIKKFVLLALIISTLILLCFKNKKCEMASIIIMSIIALLYFLPF